MMHSCNTRMRCVTYVGGKDGKAAGALGAGEGALYLFETRKKSIHLFVSQHCD